METFQKLLDFGIILNQETIDFILEEEYVESSEIFLDILLSFIKTQDENLILEVVDDDLEIFQFYGKDNKNRHIGFSDMDYFLIKLKLC